MEIGVEYTGNIGQSQKPMAQPSVQNKETSMQDTKKNSEYIPALQEKTIINAIEQANKKIAGDGKEIEFSIHEKTKQIVVKLVDTNTKKVIKEFPSEKILDMVANMCEIAGLFVDEKR